MRLGLIADIHGILPALEAVLRDIARKRVDQLICLGDVAFGPQPREVLQCVRSLGCPVIMGNADARLLDPTIPASEPFTSDIRTNTWARRLSEWCNSFLRPDDHEYMRTFLPTFTVDLGVDTLLCYHGSPRTYFDAIYATTPAEKLAEMFVGSDATILAGGHTHRQLYRRWRHRTLINSGSVGRPYDGDEQATNVLPWAEYAIITTQSGVLSIDLRHVAIDVAEIIRVTRESEMPGVESWIADYHIE